MIDAFDLGLQTSLVWGAAITLFVLVFLLPARIIQKRHSYSPWLLLMAVPAFVVSLALGLLHIAVLITIPVIVPLSLLWAFALSSPKSSQEVPA